MKLLLIISGSIAAYKSLELVREATKMGIEVDTILTKGAQHFITPLAVSSLSGRECYTDLWSLKDEVEMGHIRLAREADVILIAPASADMMAKMALGLADDLASTCLLAAAQNVMIAPAMNPHMLANSATQVHLETLSQRGHTILHGDDGTMACGETGSGRMAEPDMLLNAVQAAHALNGLSLAGKHILITAGPTQEALDPVRILTNHSSGKQGYALATAAAIAGATVTLVSGPTNLPTPAGVKRVDVRSAQEMHDATLNALPADAAICCAAVSDWQLANVPTSKQKKNADTWSPELVQTPDILRAVSAHEQRPHYVVGFAAETDDVETHAKAKLVSKGCDMVIANQVGNGITFGQDESEVLVCTPQGAEPLAAQSKLATSVAILTRISEAL